jgi:hypothetical protein
MRYWGIIAAIRKKSMVKKLKRKRMLRFPSAALLETQVWALHAGSVGKRIG